MLIFVFVFFCKDKYLLGFIGLYLGYVKNFGDECWEKSWSEICLVGFFVVSKKNYYFLEGFEFMVNSMVGRGVCFLVWIIVRNFGRWFLWVVVNISL